MNDEYILIEQVVAGSKRHKEYRKIREYFSNIIIEEESPINGNEELSHEYIDIFVKEDCIDFIKNTFNALRSGVDINELC